MRDGETLIKNLKWLVRDKETQLKKLESEMEELKGSVRFTRVNELEREVKQHFQEALKLKRILEHKKADVPFLNFGETPGQSLEFAEREKALVEAKTKLRAAHDHAEDLQSQLQRLKEEYSTVDLDHKKLSDKNHTLELDVADLQATLEQQKKKFLFFGISCN